jgi:hypothetical protein
MASSLITRPKSASTKISATTSPRSSTCTPPPLIHKWWEFEFIVERDDNESTADNYRIVAEVFLPDGTLLAKADELLSIDFNYGTRHHEDIYLKAVLIV